MTGAPCAHCGETHPPSATFCPNTGRQVRAQAQPPAQPPAGDGQPPPGWGRPPPGYGPPGPGQPPPGYGAPPPGYPQPPPQAYPPQGGYGPPPPGYGQAPPQGYAPPGGYSSPYAQLPPGYGAPQGYGPGGVAPGLPGGAAKPIRAILTEAFDLYKRNIATLLVTSAIILVPLSLVKSAAVAAMLAPTVAVTAAAQHTIDLSRRATLDWQKELQDAQGDPKKLEEVQLAHRKQLEDLSRHVVTNEKVALGGLMAWLLGLLAMLVGVAVMYGIAIPIVTWALTIVVADRATGGHMGPAEAYGLVRRRLGKLVSAWIPAFLLIMVGLFFLVLPGLVIGFLFVFVAPVVLLENVGGTDALKRSVQLVKTNLPQVAVVCLVFIALRIVASVMSLFIPHGWFFWDSFVQDVLLVFLMPIPIIGTVLLYLDIRRQSDGLDARGVRAGIDGLR